MLKKKLQIEDMYMVNRIYLRRFHRNKESYSKNDPECKSLTPRKN